MKKFILCFAFCLISYLSSSQETYTIDDKTYRLIKETDGSLNLFWNIIRGRDRYFVQKDSSLIELVNTKDENRKRKFEYKDLLAKLTSDKNMSVDKIKLKLMSLKTFIDAYNLSIDPDYKINPKGKLLARFNVFTGVSNSPFLDNPNHTLNSLLGVEFEFSEATVLTRHSIYFQGKQIFASRKFDFSATQIIVGYRFRIITKKTFNFYTSLDLARYAYVKAKYLEPNDTNGNDYDKENGFEVPITFNLGADIKLNERSFLTVSYNELFSFLSDGYESFPVSFTVGYKINL
jgi:hypothetical protein